MRTSLAPWSLLLVGTSLVACGGGVTADTDGSVGMDGSTGHDGSVVDTGTPPGDSGSVVDTGTPPGDGGSDVDTGTPPPDGAVTTDSGTTCASDGVDCTVDGIDGSGACAHLPSDMLCLPGGHCDVTAGCMYPTGCDPTMCDDGNPCTIDGCMTGGSGCGHTVDVGAPCDDGMATTSSDHCVSRFMSGMTTGVCQGSPISCDDMNPCTIDTLSASGTCTHPPTDQPCTDHDACTTRDHCNMGVCVGTAMMCSSSSATCCPATGTCLGAGMCIPSGP